MQFHRSRRHSKISDDLKALRRVGDPLQLSHTLAAFTALTATSKNKECNILSVYMHIDLYKQVIVHGYSMYICKFYHAWSFNLYIYTRMCAGVTDNKLHAFSYVKILSCMVALYIHACAQP